MRSWTSGYVADIDYTFGFYRELTPSLLTFCAMMANLAVIPSQAAFRYCELGCGQGLTANIIAAANSAAEIYANDFNPSQIAGAKQLADEAGLTNIKYYEHTFADFIAEPSLPASFDIIVLHGIFSWVSAENRQHIVEFIQRKLRPGGLVFISYNTLPGWAQALPLRHLFSELATSGATSTAARIELGIEIAERLIAAKAAYFLQNDTVAGRLANLKGLSRSYLAHEFMNSDWTPFYFADVVRELSDAKLNFLCSAHLPDTYDSVNLTTDQISLLNGAADPIKRQSLRDFMVNQQFRRDIFVKGGPFLTPAASQIRLLDQRFALSVLRSDASLKLQTPLGEVQLQPMVYEPILDRLAAGPATMKQLVSEKSVETLGWARLREALALLVGSGQVQPCLPAHDEARRSQRTKAFNAAVLRRAEWSADINHLASPVTGGGLHLDRLEQMFLQALPQKGLDPVERAWALLSAQGQGIVKNGKLLEAAADNLDEIRLRLSSFTEKKLPVLRQLGIA